MPNWTKYVVAKDESEAMDTAEYGGFHTFADAERIARAMRDHLGVASKVFVVVHDDVPIKSIAEFKGA
jgi:hypothetical protein